jgi:hypothetical protein
MSDYLKHLAARSLESAPSVQPRLASRFEPATLAAAPTAFDPAFDAGRLDATDDARQLNPPEAHAPSHTEGRRHAADSTLNTLAAHHLSGERAGKLTGDEAVQAPEAPSRRPTGQTSPPSISTPSSVQVEPVQPPSQAASKARRTPPARALEDDGERLQTGDDARARREPSTNETALERSIRRIVAGEFEARDAEAVNVNSSRAHARTVDGARAPVVPVSIVAARATPQQREQQEASVETSAPVIRVTIGRIEVRAVTPHGPQGQQSGEARRASTAEARPDPARSLREYLKQRSGGRT